MKKAIIIGAGPAGLTAAYELLTKTDIIPVIVEADKQPGGLSKTIHYKGNHIDIGGHRFFSKSHQVIDWWLKFLPLDPAVDTKTLQLQYQQKTTFHTIEENTQAAPENSMLVRKRKSRIYYNHTLFDYPLQLSFGTLRKLGFRKSLRICFSYLNAKLFPKKPETTLEDFFRNRFGNELYTTFFKSYTEKVWGVSCHEIPASWGHQRIKNLNISKLLWHAFRSLFVSNKRIDQKGTSTSLIEQFLYPQRGPGQMWETVAEEIVKKGGQIHYQQCVTSITGDNDHTILSVETTDERGEKHDWQGDYFFSAMPVKELIAGLRNMPVPGVVKDTALSLEYRDFIIAGILTKDLKFREGNGSSITDNWIYLQDKGIRAGRLQLFHNWSPYMTAQPGDAWLGVEYFCTEKDDFWQQSDEAIGQEAVREMEQIGLLNVQDVKDCMVARVKKAYPSYYGSYKDFSVVQEFLQSIGNLYPIGRNGMHRYNNTDHSMLTAMMAVDKISRGDTDKTSIWEINTEEEYHEEVSKKTD